MSVRDSTMSDNVCHQLIAKSYAVVDMCGTPPFDELKNVITTMTDDPELVSKINAVTPGGKWPNIKTAAQGNLIKYHQQPSSLTDQRI